VPRAVAVEYQSGLRKIVPISPACLVVVRPSSQSIVSSTLTFVNSSSTTSALTVVSSPRTLSRHEAVAAGWYTGLGDVEYDEMRAEVVQKTSAGSAELITANDAPFAVRNIIPMETSDYDNDLQDELKHSPASDQFVDRPLGGDTGAFAAAQSGSDERVMVVDNETQMKVIEIIPDDVDVFRDMQDEAKKDVKPSVPVKDEFAAGTAGLDLDDDQLSRRCSSVSTETAVSEGELSASNREDFVVLAEWNQDEIATVVNTPANNARRRTKRHKRKSRRYSCWRRRSSPVSVNKARRSGGPPKTAAERHGIVDCFVSLPILRLAKTKPFVDVRNVWRLVCCRKNEIQRCRCARPPTSRYTDVTTAARKLAETSGLGVIQPSLLASRSDTLPVQLSGPTSVDGVTPLVVRQPDGTLASVVAKRTTPGGTALDANKKKYLLIKSKTGSFLVPVNNLPGASPSTPSTSTVDLPLKPSPSLSHPEMKPPTVSDTFGHRERIQQLKEQIRQQKEHLSSIRRQRSCSAVQKFELDSIGY